MTNRLRTFAVFVAAGLLAACDDSMMTTDNGTPASMPSQDPEMNCVFALAEQAGVDPSQVSSTGISANEGGQDVFLSLDGAPWNCQVDEQGNVLQLEFVGEG